jgi:hypothetical protein
LRGIILVSSNSTILQHTVQNGKISLTRLFALEFKPFEIYLGSGETIRKKKHAYTEKLHFYAEKCLILCFTRYKTVESYKPRLKALNSQSIWMKYYSSRQQPGSLTSD